MENSQNAAQHTPGPWATDAGRVKYSVNAGTRHVALVSCFQEKRGDKEENEANAALIAAAPDLLVALLDAHATIQGLAMSGTGDEEGAMTAQAREIESAIAKATTFRR